MIPIVTDESITDDVVFIVIDGEMPMGPVAAVVRVTGVHSDYCESVQP